MTPSPAGTGRPLGRRLRSYIERRAEQRRPVSLTRQRAGRILLGVVCGCIGLYAYATRDAAIRRRMIAYLSEMSGGEVRVGSARFEMFGGITLYDVRIAAPFDRRLDPSAVDPESREIFSAKSLALVHNPWLLLLGHLRVEQIIAAHPTITLAQNVDTGVRNWQLLAAAGPSPSNARGLGHRPRVTIRSAKAVAVSIHNDGGHESREEELDADVRPHPQVESALSIEVRRYSEPAERTTVIFDPGRRLVTNTPFVDARTVRLQVPRAAQRFFDQIALRGEAKLSRLVYDANAPAERDTQVQLRNVKCAIPLAMLRSGAVSVEGQAGRGAGESAVHMTGVRGTLDLRGDLLAVDIAGKVNEAACVVRGTLTGVDHPPEEIGLDVRLMGERVPAPEDPLRRQLEEDPAIPRNFRRLLTEYDPRGRFDLDLHIHRAPGTGGAVSVRGSMKPVGASGRQIEFPYRVSDLRGEVRFAPPLIHIDSLVGRHGPAEIRIDGRVDDAPRWSDARVTIDGRRVPLDDDLRRALPADRQALWDRFHPTGRADIDVQLARPGSDAGAEAPAWRTKVRAKLGDAGLKFVDFPYALSAVGGVVEFDDDRATLRGVRGRHGEATISLDGQAGLAPADPLIDLRLEARRLKLDDDLRAAMPAEVRSAFATFAPDGGWVDLAGAITRKAAGDRIGYELRATLAEAGLRYEHFPLRLSDVQGDIAIRPEALRLEGIKARSGGAVIGVGGEIRRLPDGHVADLVFTCKSLALAGELYRALPEAVKRVWDTLQPKGFIDLRSSIHYESRTGEPWWRHRSEMEAEGAAICLAPFPLPISGLSARLRLTDRRIEILSARGTAAGSPVQLTGAIDLIEGGARGALDLKVNDLTLSEDVLRAMPDGVRHALTAIRPTGRFDVHLRQLGFETDASGRTSWSFGGELGLHQAGVDLGILVRRANGRLLVQGTVEPGARFSVEARLELADASVSGWNLRNLRAVLSKPAERDELFLRDASAQAYGGEATGAAHVVFGQTRTNYDASFSIRDVQLGEYLDSTRGASAGTPAKTGRKPRAKGGIYGNLVLRGQTGTGAFREGTGEAFVREAQVWKLPLLFAIFQVLNLTPDENVFHDGWLQFYLSGDTLTFEKIDLQGRAMSFVGRGRMTLPKRELDVTLLAGSPLRLRVPLLTDLLEGASREIMEVKIGGTLSDPKIRPRPMRSLAALLELLLAPTSQPKPSRSVPPVGG